MIDRVSVGVEVLVQRQRNPLAARVFVHRDEATGFRIVVPCPQVDQPSIRVVPLAGVQVRDRCAAARLQVAEGIEAPTVRCGAVGGQAG